MPVVRELFARFGYQVDKKSEGRVKSSVNRVERVAGFLQRALVGGTIALGVKSLVSLGSEAEELANKFGAVFGDAADATNAALTDIVARTGQSRLELQEFASNIGALTKPALGSAEAAGELGARMAELALDVASFNNVEPSEALQAIRSGLIGSAEPLQRFGVDVRAAALEQEALRQGITGSIKSLTEGQRVQLRSAAILRQLGTQGALGDAARTSDQFANLSRALRGRLKELGATIGRFLIPSAEGSVRSLKSVVDSMLAWIEANQEIIRQRVSETFRVIGNVLKGIGTAATTIAKLFLRVTGVFGTLGQRIGVVAAIIGVLTFLLGAPVVLLALLAAGIGLVIDDLEEMGRGGQSVSGTLVQGFQDLIDQTGSVGRAIIEMVETSVEFWAKEFFGLTDETIEEWSTIFDVITGRWMTDLADFVMALPQFFKDVAQGIVNEGKLLFDDFTSFFGIGGPRTAARTATASPASPAVAVSAPRTNIEVNVDAQGATDPQAVADRTASQTGQSIDIALRNAQAQLP